MKTIRVISIIGLAAFLCLQGLYWLSGATSPGFQILVGIVGLATGILMFISLTHWICCCKDASVCHRDPNKENK